MRARHAALAAGVALMSASAFLTVRAQGGGGTPPQEYAGSASCRRCHAAQYETWRQSLHVQMTRPIAEAHVAGDFTQKGAPSAPFRVDYTLGARRFQGYLSALADGRLYVLPAFWHVDWKEWISWKELTPVRDAAADARQIWNINCFNCHATNIQRNFDVDTRTFRTTATEMGVGCEACHGPGRAHIEVMTSWELNPSGAPPARLKIFAARTADARAVYDSCAYCHGNKTNAFVGFVPGDRLEDFAQLALMSDPVPANDPQGDYWPDGRPSRFNRPQALTLSGCFRGGQLTCATCHAAHGSANEHSLRMPMRRSNELCTQCHQSYAGPALARHTHHPEDSGGSRCIECHMSDVNWRLLNRRRDHTFAAPVPEITARYGVPNACTTCHDDRSPEWAAARMDSWYGDAGRRLAALRVTETMYRAGSGDRTATPELIAVAVDRRRGALLRASAAGFLGRSPSSTAAVHGLIGAASDPEAMVRASATRSLGALGDVRATPALVARLVDPSRVVRAAAAEALLVLGVVRLTGSAGEALARAQEEYAVSLRTFPDIASRHTMLAWLRGSQGRADEAARELGIAEHLRRP